MQSRLWQAETMIDDLCFSWGVLGVLIFTIIAAIYETEHLLFCSSPKITSILSSKSSATFNFGNTLVKGGEDFMNDCIASMDDPIDCRDPLVVHLMMRKAIGSVINIHFYRFGKAVHGFSDNSCDMSWIFRPKERVTTVFYKDYRRFLISRTEDCSYSVENIGGYHSGRNVSKKKENLVNDELEVVESENSFARGKYLIYTGGGDRCKNINDYIWSFLCSIGEAQYLKRTLIMDLTICLSSIYTSSGQDVEGKDFRFYFDFEHLKKKALVLDHVQFWSNWIKWQKKNALSFNLVEDFSIAPMKLAYLDDTLIIRKFGSAEKYNHWHGVCEGEVEHVIQRPWNLIRKSRRLMNIVSAIVARLNWDYDSVQVRNGELWPNLDDDDVDGRNLYVVGNEADVLYFDEVRDKYFVHILDDYKDLWDEGSEWYLEMVKLNNGNAVEFDGLMRVFVNTEVFIRGNRQIAAS